MTRGRLAQLGERYPYKVDVGGSNPSTPTILPCEHNPASVLQPQEIIKLFFFQNLRERCVVVFSM